MNAREIYESGTILQVRVGSTVHGLHIEGKDDRDEMGIVIPPATHVVGLKKFEQYIHRTQPEGVKSGPGDLDLVAYSAQKFCRLALNGNPSILIALFVPNNMVIQETREGRELCELAWAFASKRAGKAFLGYLCQQRLRLEKKKGQLRVTRTDLEAQHGYDTKYAMHMIRLGYQGMEYLETGGITLPMPSHHRLVCRKIREGSYPLSDTLKVADELELSLKDSIEASELPDQPDYGAVNNWLIQSHQSHWEPTAELYVSSS